MAKRKVKSVPFNPDWKLEPDEAMAVTLTLSLNRHVPGWPGCSDAQLIAVARDVIEHARTRRLQADDEERLPLPHRCCRALRGSA